MTSPDVHEPQQHEPHPLEPRAVHRARIHGRSTPERSWTPVGTVDAGVLADVDGAGMVRMGDRTWALDWWIGAEDRWHHPSQEVAVRQRALDAAPILETALRVPGGDVIHRTFGVQATAGEWRGPAVVVEIENLTAVPVALALVVRPVTLDGPGAVSQVRSDGPVISIDGRPQMLLARDPARIGVGRSGGLARQLADGHDDVGPARSEDPSGELEVAFIVPLAHTAVARVLLPVLASAPVRSLGRGSDAVPAAPWDAPTADAVAAGWSVHGGDDVRIVSPEPDWSEALTWATRMLLLAGPDEVGACLDRRRSRPTGPDAAVRAAQVAEALARLGGTDGCDAIAGALAGAQRLGGVTRLGDRSDGTVALLHAAAAVLAGPYGATRVEDLIAPVAVAIRRIRKGRGVPDGLAPSAVRALRSLAPVLVAVGQPEVAEDALVAAATLGGMDAPRRSGAGEPTSTLDRALAVRDVVVRGAVARGSGGARGMDELRRLWDARTSSGCSDASTELVDGTGSVPCGVSGFDTAELAARTLALLDLFVADGDRGPDLLVGLPATWIGNGIEAHGMVTPWGSVSYAVRWHSGRPALLWEIEPPPGLVAGSNVPGGSAEPVVRSTGLDPDWSGTGWTGEALLGSAPEDLDGPVDDGGAGSAPPGEGDSFR